MTDIKFEPISFEKVDSLIEDHRFFRAKEVLDGMSRFRGYHPDIFRKLGDVMIALHEPTQAAKYYFYSGARNEQTSELAAIHFEKLRKVDIPSLKSSWTPIRPLIKDMPGMLRRSGPDYFPLNLLKDLEKVGFEAQLFDEWRHAARTRETLIVRDPSKPLLAILKSTAVVAFWAALAIVFFAGFATVGALGRSFLKLIVGS
jgi:hypothetical protein